MHRILPLLAALPLFLAPSVAAQDLPPGPVLLEGVIRALPDRPLLVKGQMTARDADGKVLRKLDVEMLLDWKDQPPQARYTIRDAFGRSLSFMGITWPEQAAPEFRHMKGDPLAGVPTPPLSEAIEGTDVNWIDLSLAFLRWPGARTVGQEKVQDRDCHIVDVDAPKGTPGYSGVRLWIDAKLAVVVRAESYDESVKPVRRFEVKSVRKINDRWFLGELELQTIPTKHKTRLRVQSVFDRERKQFLTKDVSEGGSEQAQPGAVDNIYAPATP